MVHHIDQIGHVVGDDLGGIGLAAMLGLAFAFPVAIAALERLLGDFLGLAFLVVLLASRGLTGTDHVDGQEPES